MCEKQAVGCTVTSKAEGSGGTTVVRDHARRKEGRRGEVTGPQAATALIRIYGKQGRHIQTPITQKGIFTDLQ